MMQIIRPKVCPRIASAPLTEAERRLTLPCVHRGAETGETDCKGGAIFNCAMHGECTKTPCKHDRLRNCRDCKDYEATAIVDHGAGGIGDMLLGLLATAKLQGEGRTVTYRIRPGFVTELARLFYGYDELGKHLKAHSEEPVPGAMQLNAGYKDEHRRGHPRPRWERYAANIGTSGYMIPPLREPDRVRATGVDAWGRIALSPWSTDKARTWPIGKWLELERMLTDAGYETLVLHDKATSETAKFKRSWVLTGASAFRLAAVVLNARCVVGSDSGIAHLGGILGRPTIVVGPSHLPRIFGAYPDMRYVTGSLGAVGPQAVFEAIQAAAPLPPRGTVLEENARLARAAGTATGSDNTRGLQEMLRSLPKMGRVVEIGSFIGVSTECFALFCDHVICVDWWANDFGLGAFEQRMKKYGNVSTIRALSVEAAKQIPDGSLDGVYVDADHSYEGCAADIDTYMPKLKPGGWMMGHDYGEDWPGVEKAVRERFGDVRVFSDTSWAVQINEWRRLLEANSVRDRAKTFLAALDRKPRRIIETGCQRGGRIWNDGCSTLIFAMYVAEIGGELHSVDSCGEHCDLARRETAGLRGVTIHQGDSVSFLEGQTGRADLVYLDSLDVEQPGHEEHCLREAQAASKITDAILIDDTPGKGKGAQAIPWLVSQGWRIAERGYQCLLVRGEG